MGRGGSCSPGRRTWGGVQPLLLGDSSRVRVMASHCTRGGSGWVLGEPFSQTGSEALEQAARGGFRKHVNVAVGDVAVDWVILEVFANIKAYRNAGEGLTIMECSDITRGYSCKVKEI